MLDESRERRSDVASQRIAGYSLWKEYRTGTGDGSEDRLDAELVLGDPRGVRGPEQGMDLKTVLMLLDGEIVSRQPNLDQVFSAGSAADLMSDVLTFASPESLLLTGLINPQVVRTAEMAGIRAIVFVRGKRPPAETVALAEETGISLLRTRYTMFEASGRLYAGGLPGRGPCDSYGPPELPGP